MKRISATLLFTLCFAFGVFAQKVGYVSSAEVISIMPETKSIANQLETYAQSLLTPDIKNKSSQLDTKLKAYQAEEKTMGEARKEVAQQEIVRLQQEINQFYVANQLNQKITAKENELMAPVYKKAGETINAVAKENGYTVVIDSSVGSLLYADDTAHLLPLIKTKLGVN
ncbi:MAG: OmpH family outer membrane protein [Saprospiraceae bacterium]|nr:OmpH family outer membrane protein [Saprospiraceae bacterium]